MATDSGNAGVARAGEVYRGPTSATAPTGTASATTGFDGLGYLSDAGITEARDRSTNNIVAWQNGDTVRTLVTEAGIAWTFTMLETKTATVEEYYGTLVTESATEGTYDINPSSTGGRKSYIIDTLDGAELERVYISEGEVTEVGERTRVSSDIDSYEVTVTGYPSAALGGACARVWSTRLKTPA